MSSRTQRRASAAAVTRGRSTPTRYSPAGPLSLLAPLFARVYEVVAPVLGPCAFVVSGVARLLFPEAHGLDLLVGRTVEQHHAFHRIGTALAQRDIVFAAAAFVAVTLDGHLSRAIALQIHPVRIDQRLVIILDRVAVEVEEHVALGQRAARILEWIALRGRACHAGA